MSCEKPSIRIGVLKGDLRSASAVVAQSGGVFAKSGPRADIRQFDDEPLLVGAIRSGQIEAAYISASSALALASRGEADLKILVFANRANFVPDIVIACRTDWAQKHSDAIKKLIAAHQGATQLIIDQNPAAVESIAKWSGKNSTLVKSELGAIRFEAGIDRAALIGILDDLRRAKSITPDQAEKMAGRLIQEEAEAGQP